MVGIRNVVMGMLGVGLAAASCTVSVTSTPTTTTVPTTTTTPVPVPETTTIPEPEPVTTITIPVPVTVPATIPTTVPPTIPPTTSPPSTFSTALVSWYGGESGDHTANGDLYNPFGLTFAHLTLPFGSQVRFCGPLGCVVATCTDRGPASWTGKTFDLSEGAFQRIANLSDGVATVTWERV